METQKLEKEPLSNPDDSIEPPPGLASRTCTKIWAIMDDKEQDYTPDSGTFLNSAFFSPETVLPPSYLLGASEPEEARHEAPKARKRVETDEVLPRKTTPWIGLVASVSVGMVIAGFLFPMIIIVTRSTQSHVTEHWTNEINRRVGTYEQIHANHGNVPHTEALAPYNLAASSWQELRPELFTHSPRRDTPGWGVFINLSQTPFEAAVAALAPAYAAPYAHETFHEVMQEQQSPVFLLEDFLDWDILVPSDMNAMADSMLLVTPEQGSSVRTAFGQNILLRDGRVFFRILPGTESPKR